MSDQHSLNDFNGGDSTTGSDSDTSASVTAQLSERPVAVPPAPDADSDLSATALSFTLSGQWGHFRRIEGNAVKQTYRIPPRTTVAGMIAAIIGYDRDTYYEQFNAENAAIAVTPQTRLRTVNMPQNILKTAKTDGDMQTVIGGDGVAVKMPETFTSRKQVNYELLKNPVYRIDVRLASDAVYQQLQTRLENRETAYPISLGQSEYLCTLTYNGEHEVERLPEDVYEVDSAIPNGTDLLVPTTDDRYPNRTERSPAVMENDGYSRRLKESVSWCVNHHGGPLKARCEPANVGGNTVMFY